MEPTGIAINLAHTTHPVITLKSNGGVRGSLPFARS